MWLPERRGRPSSDAAEASQKTERDPNAQDPRLRQVRVRPVHASSREEVGESTSPRRNQRDAHAVVGANAWSQARLVLGTTTLLALLFLTWATSPPIVVPGREGVEDLSFETCEGVVEASDPIGPSGGARISVRVTTGTQKGTAATVTLAAPSIIVRPGLIAPYAVGDRVVLSYRATTTAYGEHSGLDGRTEPFQITDRVRRQWLWVGVAAIALTAAVVAGWQGLRAMLGLGVAGWLLWFFVVPRILTGEPPVLVVIAGSVLIAVTALLLTHGFTRDAAVPLAGMAGSLAVAGGLSAIAVRLATLSGLGSSEDIHLVHAALRGEIDTQGLLLAGMLLGAVGGLIDVTVAQTAAVFAMADATTSHASRTAGSEQRLRSDLFWRGMHVGRAHVVAAVHTLVLAYAGASLPVLLLFALYATELGDVWNRELLVSELLRAVTGTIGLGVAMPLTTWIACRVAPINEK